MNTNGIARYTELPAQNIGTFESYHGVKIELPVSVSFGDLITLVDGYVFCITRDDRTIWHRYNMVTIDPTWIDPAGWTMSKGIK